MYNFMILMFDAFDVVGDTTLNAVFIYLVTEGFS